MPKRILIADDDTVVLKLYSLEIESRGLDMQVMTASSGNDAIRSIETHNPDMLILDIRMQQGDGFVVLEHLHKQQSVMPVIILTNYDNPQYRERAGTFSSVREYLVKNTMRMNQVIEKINGYLEVA